MLAPFGLVTLVVALVSGLGTWLVAPSGRLGTLRKPPLIVVLDSTTW